MFYQKNINCGEDDDILLIVFMKAFTICNYPLIGDQFSHAYLTMGDESYTLLISYYTLTVYTLSYDSNLVLKI